MTEDRFANLYQLHGQAIYARCLRLLRDAAAAEDATQETFFKLHRHLNRAPEGEAAKLWIFRVATNVCLSQLRANRVRTGPPPDLSPERSTEDLLSDRDLALRIITRAPAKLGEPAWLHYVDGLDQDEVAQVLGISRRTVINRLQKFARNARKFATRGDL